MEFSVPQFIEREMKVIGGFTFRQFIFVAIAGGITIILFLLKLPLFFSLGLGLILMGFAFALAFLRIEGFPLPTLIKNSFLFLVRPKIYLWKRKTALPKILKRGETKRISDQEKREPILKIVAKSHLNELVKFLETRGR